MKQKKQELKLCHLIRVQGLRKQLNYRKTT